MMVPDCDQRDAGLGEYRLLLTPREAAQALGVCEKTIYNLTASGMLPKVCIGRAVRYHRTDLETFVERQKQRVQQVA
jgi:excisionase family DNA binding protein